MIQRYAQIWFFRKGSGTSFLPHFVNDFTRKVFLMLYYINWPNFVVFFLLLLKIFDNICFSIACFQACDVINSEIKLVFLVKLFCYMTRKSRQKFKYIENEKSFWGGIKSIFRHFEKALSCQKLSQTWECALKSFARIWTGTLVTYHVSRTKIYWIVKKSKKLRGERQQNSPKNLFTLKLDSHDADSIYQIKLF